MPDKAVTIFDIAEMAGVSIATVSRALSKQYNPRSPKHRKVLEIAQQYNYTPSAAARSLGSGQSKTLLLVLPDIENPYYSEVYSRVDEYASKAGYVLSLQRFHNEVHDLNDFRDQVISRRPDGIIVSGWLVEEPMTDEKVGVLHDISRYIPIVILGVAIERFPCISVYGDLAGTCAKQVRHLHALGHRRIALVGGAAACRGNNDREEGYYREMLRLSLTPMFDDRQTTGHRPETGVSGVLRLFTGVTEETRPTGLICINDLVALGALRQLTRMGLRVPEDVAVMGCDNQFFTGYTNPPLTTMDLNIRELARLAVHYVVNDARSNAFHHQIDSTLILRESCGSQRTEADA